MRVKIYRNAIVALILTNGWTLYLSFKFLTGEDAVFGRSWELLIDYLYGLIAGAGLGCIAISLRLLLFKKERSHKIQDNFLYAISGIFNLYLAVISSVATVLGLLRLQFDYVSFLIAASFGISLFILSDLRRSIAGSDPK